MKKRNYEKSNINISEIIIKFFIGFLIPYIFINGLVLLLIIYKPTIIIETPVLDNDKSYISFTVDSFLPLKNVSVMFSDPDINIPNSNIEYTKSGNTYTIDVSKNGEYKISAIAINGNMASTNIPLGTLDDTPPNIGSVLLSSNSITFNVTDQDSAINYDEIYAYYNSEDGRKTINPEYIDKSTGTVQFSFDDSKELVIHVEDMKGNAYEYPIKEN